jgi:hypothetical protein
MVLIVLMLNDDGGGDQHGDDGDDDDDDDDDDDEYRSPSERFDRQNSSRLQRQLKHQPILSRFSFPFLLLSEPGIW